MADGSVGKHRRAAVGLAATPEASRVLYCDLDHVLRWVEVDRTELERCLEEPSADFVVIGRSERAMRACPARLRDTEAIVNHIYRLVTGHAWDLMFAVRSMTPAAARVIVDRSTEDTIANDVEWPVLAERSGLSVGYREADGLSYRVPRDFDVAHDAHDANPSEWAHRVELANLQAQTLKRLYEQPSLETSRVD